MVRIVYGVFIEKIIESIYLWVKFILSVTTHGQNASNYIITVMTSHLDLRSTKDYQHICY